MNSLTSVEFETPLWSQSVTTVPKSWSSNHALTKSDTSVEFTTPSAFQSAGQQVLGTSSWAAALVTLPHPFVTTTSYAPASSGVTPVIVHAAPVAPVISTPSLRHWK